MSALETPALSVDRLANAPTDTFALKHLAVLCEVARRGSFAAAAEALSFSPSAVSQQMAALERDAGASLFERTPRGTRLSPAGHVMLTHAQAILERIAQAATELEAMKQGKAGALRIGSFTSATSVFVAHAVERFRERHPAVGLSFADGEPYENIARIKAGELDMAVVFEFDHWEATLDYDGLSVGGDLTLSRAELFDDPLLVILPAEHHLAQATALEIDQISEERLLGASPWVRDLSRLAERAECELRLDLSFRATGYEALQTFVLAGRGITLMPRLALGWLREGLIAVPLKAGPVRRVKIVHRVDPAIAALTDAMVGVVRATALEFGLAVPDTVLDGAVLTSAPSSPEGSPGLPGS